MPDFSDLRHGEVNRLHETLERAGFTPMLIRQILGKNSPLATAMLRTVAAALRPKLGFAGLDEKIETVKTWPGIKSKDIDAARARAGRDGTIAGYEKEAVANPFLDLVVTVYRSSIPETLAYARDRLQDAWGDNLILYQGYRSIDQASVKAAYDAKPFTPDRIVIEAIDFAANCSGNWDLNIDGAMVHRMSSIADFGVLYNAAQSQEWIKQMEKEPGLVPSAVVPSLLLTPSGEDEQPAGLISPSVMCSPSGVKLVFGARSVGADFRPFGLEAVPMLRRYQ